MEFITIDPIDEYPRHIETHRRPPTRRPGLTHASRWPIPQVLRTQVVKNISTASLPVTGVDVKVHHMLLCSAPGRDLYASVGCVGGVGPCWYRGVPFRTRDRLRDLRNVYVGTPAGLECSPLLSPSSSCRCLRMRLW